MRAHTKEYGSSWIFEPCLTWANALRRVQHPGFSLVAEVMESPSKMAAHRSVGRKLQELDHVLRHGPVGVLRRRRLQLNATRVAAATTPSPRRGGSPYPGARPLGSARLSVQPGLAPRQFPSWRQETSGSSSGDAGQPAVAQSARRPLAAAPSPVCCTRSCSRSWPAPPGPWPCCSWAPRRPRVTAKVSLYKLFGYHLLVSGRPLAAPADAELPA
jgi:hypothetical protein